MGRLLALLMRVVPPLLSSWSVASAHCGDESPARSTHPGHHVDQHRDDRQGAASDDQGTASSEAHCDHCHSPGATLIGEVGPLLYKWEAEIDGRPVGI
ncbi:DUF2946 family protein [Variovorax brevis]|uniref:DUF2946 family protein n=1 Tax=Variovorax brevis TaxID=3053503 RepID=UPI004037AA67